MKEMKTIVTGSTWLVRGVILALLLVATIGCSSKTNGLDRNILTDTLSTPLNGATAAKIDLNAGGGNLTIDRLTSGEQLLASGTLQYSEKQGLPTRTLNSNNGQTVFSLSMGDPGRGGFHFPWEACNSETEWNIHLNPAVSSDITAHTGGGNVKLDLSGMAVTQVSADTGGGNVEVVLPDNASVLNVNAKSGAGNVSVRIPNGVAAKLHMTTGLGKVIVDPQFSMIDKNTYQTPGYDSATSQVEITLSSGAGNVSVITN